MKKLLSIITLLTLVMSLSLTAVAKGKKVTMTGVVIDKMCASRGENHTRACALKCKDGGIGLYADGKFYQFDEKGTAEAIKLMEASKAEKAMKVEVSGELADDSKLTVESIKEVS
ncbi:MAG TPA: hypothetical protein VEF04_21830 [Blastocatellia bacterium]|nr:hypothetical protein [Blastocatellia bacterium]